MSTSGDVMGLSSKSSLSKLALIGAVATMPFLLNGCGLLLVGATTTAATTSVTEDSRSISTMVYDEDIEQQSYKILKSNSLLTKPADFSISVTAFNGNVLVTGQTINRDYLKWVVRQIEGLEHVRKVYNYATLQAPVPASVVTSDSYITSQIKTKLLFGKDINSNRFKVVTENGNVFLMGIVTRDEASRAINTVLGIDGVRKVYHIFDYIEVQQYNTNGAQQNEKIVVSPVKGDKATYSAPANSRSYNYDYNPNYVAPSADTGPVYSKGSAAVQNANYGYSNTDYGTSPAQLTQPQAQPAVAPAAAPVANPQPVVNPQPATNSQNGGAYIIDDAPISPNIQDDAGLLTPYN